MRIDIYGSRELQATVLSIRRAERDIQTNIRKFTKTLLMPEWKKALAERAETRLEHRALVSTARITMSNQNIKLKSAGLNRKLSGGMNPNVEGHAVEFGANREEKTTYDAVSKNGTGYRITRRTRRQLRPKTTQGYVFYPAVRAMIPRFASLWVQTTVRTLADALDRR
ncbi:hypothetical protein [Plantibacter sp. VKM Ac-2876]|jgi:hypothetical protein|uniref:hypothetical protein n=1 Tax=Plantibacter sp. VKM Ac-2876 TaxID=2783826 RepID=UPI00188D31A9|nr:hypothetical protein [Plantibacter sp. VKM Ac-2876]MBF4565400.1 hypothetical protein [Plantibacter sp. VKM Ac-2876]